MPSRSSRCLAVSALVAACLAWLAWLIANCGAIALSAAASDIGDDAGDRTDTQSALGVWGFTGFLTGVMLLIATGAAVHAVARPHAAFPASASIAVICLASLSLVFLLASLGTAGEVHREVARIKDRFLIRDDTVNDTLNDYMARAGTIIAGVTILFIATVALLAAFALALCAPGQAPHKPDAVPPHHMPVAQPGVVPPGAAVHGV